MKLRPILAGMAVLALLTGCSQTPEDVTTAAPATNPVTTTAAPEPADTTETVTVTAEPTETSEAPTETAEPTESATGRQTLEPTATGETVAQPTNDNLPSELEVNWPNEPQPLTYVDSEGMGQASMGVCDPGEYGDPTTVLRRDFTYAEDGSPGVMAVVFGYESTEAANAGYESIYNAALNCEAQLEAVPLENVSVIEDHELVFHRPSAAQESRASHFTSMGIYPGEDQGLFNISMVVQTDDRVAWVVESFQGQDHNCSISASDDVVGQCKFPANIDAIAERLVSDYAAE